MDGMTWLIEQMSTPRADTHDWQSLTTARTDIIGRWRCSRCRAARYLRRGPNRVWLDYYDATGLAYQKEEPPCA